jgi:TatD DNase family protein
MEPLKLPPVIDTHCHLDFPEFDCDREDAIARAMTGGIEYLINAGSTVESSRKGVELSRAYERVYACVGCHPHDADSFSPEGLAMLETLCAEKKVVAIGETGLDYYRNLSSPANQRRVFESHIDLAARKGLPLVVHSRDAREETLAVLKEKKVKRAIIHCFAGDAAFLSACLELGLYVSFTCNITYKKAEELRAMVKLCPLDRMCVETDAPYLSPEGLRGRRNEPVLARRACEQIAAVKGISVEEAAVATTANAKLFFKIGDKSGTLQKGTG